MAKFIPYQTGRGFCEPTPETFQAFEEAIQWAENEVPTALRWHMDQLVFHMALVNQGEARKMSFGPLDPRMQDPSAAWQIPVRRISERYYFGWKLRRIGPAAWQLYNDSREAYFIEFGIHQWGASGTGGAPGGNPRRVRRPIRKLSLLRTMEILSTTEVYHRVWVSIYKSKHTSANFTQIVQSPGMGTFEGPILGRQLP